MPTHFAPMLATSARTVPEGDQWAWEPKLDGWRCIVEVDDVAFGSAARRACRRSLT